PYLWDTLPRNRHAGRACTGYPPSLSERGSCPPGNLKLAANQSPLPGASDPAKVSKAMRRSRRSPSLRESLARRPMSAQKSRKSALTVERLEARELLANSFLQGPASHDLNVNGVFDVNEPRLAGATVRVFRGAEQNPLQTVTTDNNGYYRFNNLPPDNY